MTQPPTWGPPPPQEWQPQPQGTPWPTPVPPKRGGPWKWVLGGVALLAVIAVTVVVTVTYMKSNDSNGNGGPSGPPSDIASANDKGPIGIITEDPSCGPWNPVANAIAKVEDNGWGERDPSIPASAWTPDMRAKYEAVGNAMREAARQAIPLAKITTHRVMRELYGQFTVYSRMYADSTANYAPRDDVLAQISSSVGDVLTNICSAISGGAAAARASLVPAQAPPTNIAPIGDPSNPIPVFTTPDPICAALSPTLDKLLTDATFKAWINTDPAVPASDWNTEQQLLTSGVKILMSSTANDLAKLATQTTNPIVQDFITLGVVYRRTYVESLTTYQPYDTSIYVAGQYLPGIISGVCEYVADK